MSDTAPGDELTCPFCGRIFPAQDALTDHFTNDHDIEGF